MNEQTTEMVSELQRLAVKAGRPDIGVALSPLWDDLIVVGVPNKKGALGVFYFKATDGTRRWAMTVFPFDTPEYIASMEPASGSFMTSREHLVDVHAAAVNCMIDNFALDSLF